MHSGMVETREASDAREGARGQMKRCAALSDTLLPCQNRVHPHALAGALCGVHRRKTKKKAESIDKVYHCASNCGDGNRCYARVPEAGAMCSIHIRHRTRLTSLEGRLTSLQFKVSLLQEDMKRFKKEYGAL